MRCAVLKHLLSTCFVPAEGQEQDQSPALGSTVHEGSATQCHASEEELTGCKRDAGRSGELGGGGGESGLAARRK